MAAMPQYIGATSQSTINNPSVTWPAGHLPGDLALLFIETRGDQVMSSVSGWTFIGSQATGSTSTDTALSAFYRIVDSTAMATFSAGDSGDHTICSLHVFRGARFSSGNPWDVSNGGAQTSAGTTITVTGVTTTLDNCLVVQACSHELSTGAVFSGQTNSDLANITERADINYSGGAKDAGIGVWTGEKATAGAVGSTTVTATSSTRSAFITLALAPESASPFIRGIGTLAGSAGAPSPTWPTTHFSGDFGLLIVETANESIAAPSGWTQIGSMVGVGSAAALDATAISLFYRFATSSSEASASLADAGDHTVGRIIAFGSVADTGNPYDVLATGTVTPADTSITFPGVTTTVNDTLVLNLIATSLDSTTGGFAGGTNADLTRHALFSDGASTAGNGGAIGAWAGWKPAAGSVTGTTATCTSAVKAMVTLALRAPAPAGAIIGSSTVTFAQTGAVTGAGTLAGSATLAFSSNPTLAGSVPAAGTSTLSFTQSAAGTLIGALAGSGTLAFTQRATLNLVGSAPVTFGSSAQLQGAGACSATTALAFSQSAALAGAGALAGSSAVSFDSISTLTSIGSNAIVGSAALAFSTAATLAGAGALTGSATLSFTQTGAGTLVAAAVGSTTLTLSSSGTLPGAGALVGASLPLGFTPTGALLGSAPLAGSSALTAAATATLGGETALSSTASLAFSAAGDANLLGLVDGAALLSVAATATLLATGSLLGSTTVRFSQHLTLFAETGTPPIQAERPGGPLTAARDHPGLSAARDGGPKQAGRPGSSLEAERGGGDYVVERPGGPLNARR